MTWTVVIVADVYVKYIYFTLYLSCGTLNIILLLLYILLYTIIFKQTQFNTMKHYNAVLFY